MNKKENKREKSHGCNNGVCSPKIDLIIKKLQEKALSKGYNNYYNVLDFDSLAIEFDSEFAEEVWQAKVDISLIRESLVSVIH